MKSPIASPSRSDERKSSQGAKRCLTSGYRMARFDLRIISEGRIPLGGLRPSKPPESVFDRKDAYGPLLRYAKTASGLSWPEAAACRKSPPSASFSEMDGVSLSSPWDSRAGNAVRKPCAARLPNPPHMSPDSDDAWRAAALQTTRKGFLTVCRLRPFVAGGGLVLRQYCVQARAWRARMYASIAFAACLPAPMARMTVAAPVTASPPA